MEKKRGEKPKRCKDKSLPTSHQLGHDSPSFVVSMVSCSPLVKLGQLSQPLAHTCGR